MSHSVLARSVRLHQEKVATYYSSSSSELSSIPSHSSLGSRMRGQAKQGSTQTPPSSSVVRFNATTDRNDNNASSKTTVPMASTRNPTASRKSGNKKCRSSPFRIKVGCLVAIRYRHGGNRVSVTSSAPNAVNGNNTGVSSETVTTADRSSFSFSEVWTDPQPGRDEGWALIGRRVRCAFPKFVLSREFQDGKKATTRMLEGEIVSIVDYPNQLKQAGQRKRKRSISHRGISPQNLSSHGTLVELLVDQDRLSALPFLRRTDPIVDIDKLSESAKRGHLNEERVRGKGKAIVEVLLADAWGVATAGKHDVTAREEIVARWAIRKRVPSLLPERAVSQEKPSFANTKKKSVESNNGSETPKLESHAGKLDASLAQEVNKLTDDSANGTEKIGNNEEQNKSTSNGIANESQPPQKKRRRANGGKKEVSSASRYVGDGNDSSDQQEKNWRWVAGRYDPMHLLTERPIPLDYLEMLLHGLMVGEVVKVEPAPSSSSTLAMVTIKRIILPEQTKAGRMPHHGLMEIYDDQDSARSDGSGDGVKEVAGDNTIFYQFPVEELVIVSRRLKRRFASETNTSSDGVMDPNISHAYSLRRNSYSLLSNNSFLPNQESQHSNIETNENVQDKLCHRCRMSGGELSQHDALLLCKPCEHTLEYIKAPRENGKPSFKFKDVCDCQECDAGRTAKLQDQLLRIMSKAELSSQRQRILLAEEGSEKVNIRNGGTAFLSTRATIRSAVSRSYDFCLPLNFLKRVTPSSKPIVKVKPKNPKKVRRTFPAKNTATNQEKWGKSKPTREGRTELEADVTAATTISEEESVFRPTSCRLVPYNSVQRKFDASPLELYPWNVSRDESNVANKDKPRNLRQLAEAQAREGDKEGKMMNSRAARANQRRLMRDVAAIGLSFDALAGREQQLRFDRSGIHAWGVFADDDIREGEMIIEYRGEIIENAMAEKREKEYEMAKIGSDYMFRIDDYIVCDATKQGNVARFINASCDPNCYTKIISIDGSKRIGIYAKRDIGAGEELCYDYKFPLEYDESKRIPCHCQSPDCRGFMNWDKKYVALPDSDDEGATGSREQNRESQSSSGAAALERRGGAVNRVKHA